MIEDGPEFGTFRARLAAPIDIVNREITVVSTSDPTLGVSDPGLSGVRFLTSPPAVGTLKRS